MFLHDRERIEAMRARVDRRPHPYEAAVARMRSRAERAMRQPRVSVVDKHATPPSGDKHDYMSLGLYFWPDPTKPDGLPYVERDGEVNPQTEQYDRVPLSRMSDAVAALGWGWHYTRDKRFVGHAAALLRHFFIDPATAMNPHLAYGQFAPGVAEGRCYGIIETSVALPGLIDAVLLLETAPAYPTRLRRELRQWMARFLDWLLHSRLGQEERAVENNHGVYYDVLVAVLALFTGEAAIARQRLEDAPRRVAAQIAPDGGMPRELQRTRSWMYSCMNLVGFMRLALLSTRVGLDLWDWRSADGRSVRGAYGYLLDHARGPDAWPLRQITPISYGSLRQACRVAAMLDGQMTSDEPAFRHRHDDSPADTLVLRYPLPGDLIAPAEDESQEAGRTT